ncbi:MAG: HAMP domain-containing histidine kinase [Magnetococcales bacterium]|nr:HAMP domain-containing histidine kinase [Magnetococcales bacterium]
MRATPTKSDFPFLEWDTSVCEKGLRTTEMSDRGWWFIRTRWNAAGLCFLGALWALLPPLQDTPRFVVDYRFFLVVGVLLALSNIMYARMAKNLITEQPSKRRLCRFLSFQVLTDYVNLSILTYGLGGVETPILILFLPHIILLTLFFSRSYSFVMTWVGIFFASLPILLEYMGWVPTISIFDNTMKVMGISSSLVVTASYILGISAAFLICWYLVGDITAILLMRERQLEEAFHRLQLLDQEKSQITLRATHELKAPFAAIKSYVYTLRDGYCGPLPDKAKQVVERIGERCDLLMEKIADIIHLSNLRTLSPSNVGLTETDLMSILVKEVEDARLIGQPKGIEVTFLSRKAPCYMMASREHLSTMISNLLRNAVNYSHPGGTVDVTLNRAADKVTLHIVDHGIGIPEDHLDKIFEEHFRSNNAVRFNPNSSGMGLALVREIIRLHGGEIHVTSQLGAGSRFSVTLTRLTYQPKSGDDHGKNSDYR